MRIQRTFSKTWENLKTPEEREKKKNELKTKREKINKRRDQIKQDRLEGLEKSAMGENIKYVTDKAGKRIKDKDGNFWTNPVSAKEVEARYKAQMEDLNAHIDSILDKTHRKPAPKPVPVPPSKSEVLIGKVKKLAKNPKTKNWGAAAIGATAGTLAISGIDKAIEKKKEKKKENEMKSKFSK